MPSSDPSQALKLDAMRAQSEAALQERDGWWASIDSTINMGRYDLAGINALSPVDGMSLFANEAGTPSATGSVAVAVGDLIEYQGSSLGWRILTPNEGGCPAAGVRTIVSFLPSPAPVYPFTANDKGRIAKFAGGTWATTYKTPVDGDVVTSNGGVNNNSITNQRQTMFAGVVPTGSWAATGILLPADIGDGLQRSPGGELSVKPANTTIVVTSSGVEVGDLEVSDGGMWVPGVDGRNLSGTWATASDGGGNILKRRTAATATGIWVCSINTASRVTADKGVKYTSMLVRYSVTTASVVDVRGELNKQTIGVDNVAMPAQSTLAGAWDVDHDSAGKRGADDGGGGIKHHVAEFTFSSPAYLADLEGVVFYITVEDGGGGSGVVDFYGAFLKSDRAPVV